MNGQMSLFDFIEDPDREKKEKAKAWSAKNPSDRKLDKAVNDAKKALRGLRETHAKRTGEEMAAGFAEGVLGGKEALKPASAGIERKTAEKHMETLGYISEEHARRICGPALSFEEVKDMIGDYVLMEQPRESATDWRIIRIHKYIKDYSSVFSSETEEPKGKQDRILALYDQKKRNSFLYIDELYSNGGRYPGERHNLTLYKIKEAPEEEPIRIPCNRKCDVECFSKTCFIRRGYIWKPEEQRGNWLRDKDGRLIIGPKQCDWVPVDGPRIDATFECFAEYRTEAGGVRFGECEKGGKIPCQGCQVYMEFYRIAGEYQAKGKPWGEAVALTVEKLNLATVPEYMPDAYRNGTEYDESADEWLPKNWRQGGEDGRTKKI